MKKKGMLLLLVGLFLFVGGGLFAEDLPPPLYENDVNVEYVVVSTDQVVIGNINVVDINFTTSVFGVLGVLGEISVFGISNEIAYNYSTKLGSSIFCANVGLEDAILKDNHKTIIINVITIDYLIANEGKTIHKLIPIREPSNYSLLLSKLRGLTIITYKIA